MPGVYEYIIQMQDRASGTLQKLTGTSYETCQKFEQLRSKNESLQRSTVDFGNSIGNLNQRIDILQAERDLIDPANINQIRQYNREINSLSREVERLENTTGGKFKTYAKDAFSQIPGAGLLTNPLVLAGAGVAAVSKLGISWETGMAKINTTARLSEDELDQLGSTIKKLGVDSGADLSKVPTAYEKILSQTNNVKLSTDILGISLKGAKAGFTDIDIVSGAAAQSLSAIGEGKATAAEVMDTLFAAKRVGAGEFVDFANNIPGLIAAGKNVGVTWKEVSGAFAYMTGQGNNAADSTMLLQNAFSALGKKEITDGLEAAGVKVFDTSGKMRGLLPLMTDLGKLMAGFGKNDKAKSNFLEAIGLKDQQAKQAFSVLTNETSKLQEAMDATGNAAGELQSALDQTNTPANKLKEIWSNITGTGLGLGNVINAILNPILDMTISLFKGIYVVVDTIGTAWNWWSGLLLEGNPLIWGITVLIGGLTAAIALHNLWLQKDAIWTGIVTAAKSTWALATGVLTGSIWGLNTALLANPVTWIVVGIMALIAAFVAAWKYSEKFRGAILGIWEVVKGFGNILKDFVIDRITGILKGLGGIASAIGKLFKGDFKGALQEGKDALVNLSGANAMKDAVDNGKKLGDKFKSGYQKGIYGFAKDKTEAGYVKDEKTGEWVKNESGNKAELQIPSMPEMPTAAMPSSAIDALLKKLNQGKNKKKGQKDKAIALGVPQNYNQTNAYSVITEKFGTSEGSDTGITDQVINPTEKPVINMATRVEEIAGSLRKIAAITALPVMMTLGASNIAKAEKLIPVTNTQHNINTTEVNAPVSHLNKLESVYNAFDNRLYQSSHQITNLSKSVNHVNNEVTNVADNRLYEANQQITDLSQKVNSSDFDNRLYHSSQQITDLSQKVNHITNTANHEENNLLSNVTESANNYTSSASSLTDDNSTNSLTNDNSRNYTTNNQGKTVHFDRFTDKIEIHVSGVDSPILAADQVRNEVEKALAEILNV